jgi:hypothetical protein
MKSLAAAIMEIILTSKKFGTVQKTWKKLKTAARVMRPLTLELSVS